MVIKKIKLICGAVAVVVTANSSIVLAKNADSIQNEIDKNKESIQSIDKQRDEVNKQKNQQQSDLDGILEKIDKEGKILTSINIEVNKYQADIDKIQVQIDKSQDNIKSIEDEVEQKKLLIKQKEAEEKELQEKLGKRIRNYYKVDVTSQYIYMIIKSESISRLFNNMQSVFKIMNMDKDLVEKAKSVQEQLVAENKALDEKIASIKEEQKAIIAKQDELKEAQKVFVTKQQEQQSKMNELASLEGEKSSIIASLSDKDRELAEQGKDLIASNAELEKQLQGILSGINSGNNNQGNGGNAGSSGNGGGKPINPSGEDFLRPGSGPVTDTYGHRINPVTGREEYHKGVDLGDPYGAPVYAAKSGTVSYAGWMSGYGNLVIIDHGNGVQTVYGHNSELTVSVGQTVSRGQVIAKVGATGQVTGPHIHWEIRVNGQPTDPMGYV